MKKFICAILIINLIFISLSAAQEIDETKNILSNTDFSEIENFLSFNAEELDFTDMLNSLLSGNEKEDIGFLKDCLKKALFDEIHNSFAMLAKMMALVIIFAILKQISCGTFLADKNDITYLISYFMAAFILSNVFVQALNTAKSVITQLNAFVGVSMPILVSFIAASGAAKTAACINPMILIGFEILSASVNVFFMPLILILCVLTLFSGCGENINVASLSNSIKTILKWSIGLVFTLFTGTFAVYTNFSSSADALLMRTAKYALGTSVPVAGTLLCDNMSVFTYSCSVIKNAFGAVSIFVIIFLLAVPALKLFVIMLFLNIASALTASVADKRIALLTSGISESVSYILTMVCITGAAVIVSIAIMVNMSTVYV